MQRPGRQANNDPLLVGILQTLTTNAQNHDRLAAKQKLESNKYLMFPKTVFSGDNTNEACQPWTNLKKYVQHNQNIFHWPHMMNYVKPFWQLCQEEPITGFKPLDITLEIPMIYKSPFQRNSTNGVI